MTGALDDEAASNAAQAEHERLQAEATAQYEQTGVEPKENHFGGCWCCCWDSPCLELNTPEMAE